MSIYDKTKMMCRTWIESVNNLFNMGKDLETEVDGIKGGVVSDVTLTEVDKHYTLTISYEDETHDTVTWDDSTVGIADITLTYNDGVYLLRITLEDGTVYSFSIPVGDIVTEQELTALNLGTPDDEASSTGSLWARVKSLVTTKANVSDVYTKTEVDNALSLKANDTDVLKLSGVQTYSDIKFGNLNKKYIANGNVDGWYKVARMVLNYTTDKHISLMTDASFTKTKYEIRIGRTFDGSATICKCDVLSDSANYLPSDVKLAIDANDSKICYLFVKAYAYLPIMLIDNINSDNATIRNIDHDIEFYVATTSSAEPTIGTEYSDVITATALYTYKNGVAY